jgi:hypothetical protein
VDAATLSILAFSTADEMTVDDFAKTRVAVDDFDTTAQAS